MLTSTVNRYDATIQHKDGGREIGYRETIEDITVSADSIEQAFALAFHSRPAVSRVQLHGIRGTTIAFDGPRWSRRAK